MRRMCGSVQTTLTLPPDGRRRLTAPSRTPSVIESMNVASLKSTTRCDGAAVDRVADRGAELGRGVEVRLAVDGDHA